MGAEELAGGGLQYYRFRNFAVGQASRLVCRNRYFLGLFPKYEPPGDVETAKGRSPETLCRLSYSNTTHLYQPVCQTKVNKHLSGGNLEIIVVS